MLDLTAMADNPNNELLAAEAPERDLAKIDISELDSLALFGDAGRVD